MNHSVGLSYFYSSKTCWKCYRGAISCSTARTPFPAMNFFRRISRSKASSMDHNPEVILLGDSLINRLQYAPIWSNKFASSFRCLNLGIDGLTVEGLLRRVVEGEFPIDGFHAKVIVLLIGTNNVGDTPDHIAGMIDQIIVAVRDRQPSAQLFVVELFPKGPGPSVYRDKNTAVNVLLRERLKENANLRVINLDPGFVDENGKISKTDFPDYLHFSDIAYEKAFSPLYVLLDEAVKKSNTK
ncbi:platelet-activating factor acetylhydrolase IB subunit alpha2-like isoform X2 [Paramacrobiotus metropolitanus]|nr:platelet-activating factor acetylhydrolase IB subunit alpha2-like isoform X2 [Paramacrobiotus metropolitanus]